MNGVLTSLGLVLLFVLIGGYFSGSELAVLTLRDSQVERLPGRRGDRVRKLRTDWTATRGGTAAWKAFHDDFLSRGGPPIPLVRQAMMKEDAPHAVF